MLLAALASAACDLGDVDSGAAHGPPLHVLESAPRDLEGLGCDSADPACGFPVNGLLTFVVDRPLLPYTAVRQSVAVSSGAWGAPMLLPSYDLFTLTLTFQQAGDLQPNALYRLDLPVAAKPGDSGLRAFDGAPLEASRVPTRITFKTSRSGLPFVEPPPIVEPTCADVAGLLSARCASSCCHGGERPALGLSLESPSALVDTAIRRIARQTDKGPVAGVPNENSRRFGVAMSRIEPSSAATSYLVYKLLVDPENLTPCSGDSCRFEHLPGARNCAPLDAEEIERMQGYFVAGEPMPIRRHVGGSNGCAPADNRPLDCGSLRAIERWIERGAPCP